MIHILTFLTDHRAIIVGAVATLSEVAIVLINLYRKIKKDDNSPKTMSTNEHRLLTINNLLWAANPINLFRKP